jgi:hypothetical protein
MHKPLVIALLTLLSWQSRAQSFSWWADNVMWDGVTEWPRYIIAAPAYLGPNALPVPRISNGSVDSAIWLAATGSLHFSRGDHTQNIALYANYCLVKDLISFQAGWIPYEHYSLTHDIKTRRHVFSHFYFDKQATGDIELSTTIQLLKRWRNYIHLAFRTGYRIPTSSGVGSARFTDAPGYYFDFSCGKPLSRSNLKWIAMAGFYAWQLVAGGYGQDDAFLFGSGMEWNHPWLRMQTYIAGYFGYLKGDDPVVLRSSAEKRFKHWTLLLSFQQGLHDFGYSSVEIGIGRRWK